MKCRYCDGTGEHINDANRMTTCEFCGGTGEVEVVGDSVTDVCDKCGGTGFCEMRTGDACTLGSPCPHQKPLTNDEWRRTCSTEDFAKFLEDVTSSCYHCGVTDDISLCAFQKHQCNIKEWLKEKNNEM